MKHNDRLSIHALKRLDPAAWGTAYSQLSPLVFNHVFRELRGNRDLAMEVTQEAFLHAIEGIGRFHGSDTKLLSWFIGIARNSMKKALQKQREWNPSGDIVETGSRMEPVDPAPLPDESLIRREEVELLGVVLARLPDRWETVLRWKYCDNLSLKEIATRLEMSVPGTESLLRRAKAKLTEEFFRLEDAKKELLLEMENCV